MKRPITLAMVSAIAGAVPALAASPGYTELGPNITLESGETWTQDGQRYRLYGVQSCLRGTTFTNKGGTKRDCGEASLSILAAFVKDTRPACAPVAKSETVIYVVCFSTVGGRKLDLGTMLISQGYAFAALDPQGLPVNPAYAVAEQDAKERAAGLWAFTDVTHPSILLGRATKASRERQP